MHGVVAFRCILSIALILCASSAFAGDDGVWSVRKSSGEVWVTTTGARPASLQQEEVFKPGDTIRTGGNGRVLLVRGEETMLIAPNSVIGLPTDAKDGMSTTILQQAGSMLLDVEKHDVKHFEVETPYLAAVVKGTLFIVSVNASSTSVDVRGGQVEVSDFKSGQIAQVLPGQTATSFEHGTGGLTLSGSGTFNPIEQGKPRASSIDRIPVPKGGLPAPQGGANGTVVHALGHIGQSIAGTTDAPSRKPVKPSVIRISSALGEVRLNVEKATHGLARRSVAPGSVRGASSKDSTVNATVWSNGEGAGGSTASVVSSGNSNSGSGGGGASGSGSGSAASSVTSTAATTVGNVVAIVTGNGNGNGATGNAQGNNGNGSGNGGVGNGKGNAKH